MGLIATYLCARHSSKAVSARDMHPAIGLSARLSCVIALAVGAECFSALATDVVFLSMLAESAPEQQADLLDIKKCKLLSVLQHLLGVLILMRQVLRMPQRQLIKLLAALLPLC